MKRFRQVGLFSAVGVIFLTCIAMSANGDWNQWRGPSRQGTLTGLKIEWPENLKRAWTISVGIGHSSPVIAGDYVYQFSREGEEEVVRAIVLPTGQVQWRTAYPAPYEVNPAARAHGKGPKSTPLVADGRIYTLGISGILSCLNAGSGKILWSKDFKDRFKVTAPAFGTAMSPLLDGGLLYVHVGGQDDGAILALDAASGNEKWKWSGDGPSYASPIIATFDGTRQLITQTQKMIVGLDPQTGALLWSMPYKTPYEQNIISPLVVGDRIVFAGLSNPTFAARIKKGGPGWSIEKLWESRDSMMYMANPATDGARIYGMSNRRGGQIFVLNGDTGETVWMNEGRTGDNASIIDAGGSVLIETTGADLLVMEKQPEKLLEVRRYHLAETPTWAAPAISGRYIAVKDEASLTLWEIRSGAGIPAR